MRVPVPGSFFKALAKALPQSFLSVIVDVMFATRDLHALHLHVLPSTRRAAQQAFDYVCFFKFR